MLNNIEESIEALIDKNKSEILVELGNPSNDFASDEWIYIIGKNFLGLKRRLYLFFKNELLYDYFISSLA